MAGVVILPNQTGRASIDDPRNSRWRAFAPPFQRNARGYFAPKGLRNVIWGAILNIILTPLGSRIMLPAFGSRLPELFMDPNDDLTKVLAKEYVVDAVSKWEPRVIVTDASIQIPPDDEHRLAISMSYIIKSDRINERRVQLVSRTPLG